MTASNIEQFDAIAGQTFALLYEAFPIPIALPLVKYTGEGLVFEVDGFTGSELTQQAELVMASLVWLVDSGYIRATVHQKSGLAEAVLTAKGLETLKATPGSLTTPLGERLKDAVKQDGREITRSLVSQALSIGLSLGINALK
ncbi:hypothetical protein [Aeromonas sp. Prich7-2]|uniref:hypothetical protein n=1 Tax=Aeromonas sp. Prich7-2 TaxID=2823361 RepID=UPI001B31BB98|nr:hypothetical protein [Aeromonas sp. Prich7-2]MBP4058401.1 hypothetical protein [Aeromonas sp. Prich7-2]